MNFFKEVAPLLKGNDLVVTIRGGESQLTVSVLPKSNKENADVKLSPIILSGTPEEIDESIILTLFKPLEKASALVADLSAFEKKVKEEEDELKRKREEREKKRKETMDKKKQTAKTSTPSPKAKDDDDEEEDDDDASEESAEEKKEETKQQEELF